MSINTDIYAPEYYEDIPDESGEGGDLYATTVLEYIVETFFYTCPELYAAIYDEHVRFCKAHGTHPGETSPILGCFFNGWGHWFIARYVSYPKRRGKELLRKFKSSVMEQELKFWHRFSCEHETKNNRTG